MKRKLKKVTFVPKKGEKRRIVEEKEDLSKKWIKRKKWRCGSPGLSIIHGMICKTTILRVGGSLIK